MAICDGPKCTIYASAGFGLLHMVSEPHTERCANEDGGQLRGVDCEIPHWLEWGTKHSL